MRLMPGIGMLGVAWICMAPEQQQADPPCSEAACVCRICVHLVPGTLPGAVCAMDHMKMISVAAYGNPKVHESLIPKSRSKFFVFQ